MLNSSKNFDNNNSYYSFDDEKRGIVIHRHDTPQPWINYLSNGRFHAFVSQACGGFSWWKSPMVYRLTRYRQMNLPIDSPGFYVYIKQADGTVWSPGFRPCETALDAWQVVHQPGMTTFSAEKDGVKAELCFFVSQTDDVLIWWLNLNSIDGREHRLDVYAYAEFSQLSWDSEALYGYYDRHQLRTWYQEQSETINYLFHPSKYPGGYEPPLVYFSSNEPVVSYSGNRNTFIGNYGNEALPCGVKSEQLADDTIECGEPCGALHCRIILLSDGTAKDICYYLGASEDAINDLEACEKRRDKTLERLRQPGETSRQSALVKDWWNRHFSVLQCEIPDVAGMRQINTWNVMNSVVTGRYSRSVNIDAPGVRGVGFRDTCQDMMAICYRDPEWAVDTLKYLLSLQYTDGHVLHKAHRYEWLAPAASVHSDDHLWLIYLIYAILAETGDYSLLEQEIPFYGEEKTAATVWEHLLKAVEFTERNLGCHGLPIILRSDWNDIIGKFNKHGRGESVFAAQQFIYALKRLIEIARETKRDSDYFENLLQEMAAAVTNCAWDGKWWRRAFDDDGNPVGSRECDHGRIFLNTQSWSVIAGLSDEERNLRAMDSANEQLNTGIGLKLLTPSFAGWHSEAGKTPVGYGPGCGENGAIFCHSNTWAIIAEALLGNGRRAWEYFSQLTPNNIAQKIGIEKYRAEPYAWVSNIVGPENPQFGWGNVSQITGTAPWMDVAATQYLLGVRPIMKGLLIDPCIPSEWKEFSAKRIYRGCLLNIHVLNPNGLCKGIQSITIDNKKLDITYGGIISPAVLDKKISADVKVIMGNGV